jgi:hypothetical protein
MTTVFSNPSRVRINNQPGAVVCIIAQDKLVVPRDCAEVLYYRLVVPDTPVIKTCNVDY